MISKGVMTCPPQTGFLSKYGQKLNLLGRDRGGFSFLEGKKKKDLICFFLCIILCLPPFVAFSLKISVYCEFHARDFVLQILFSDLRSHKHGPMPLLELYLMVMYWSYNS